MSVKFKIVVLHLKLIVTCPLSRPFGNLCVVVSWSERRKDQDAELLARQYLEEEQRQKEEKQRREIEDKEEMRRMLLEQMEKKATEEASNNLRVQKYEYRKSLFDLDCSVSFHVLNQVNESGQLLLCCSRNYPSPPPPPPHPLTARERYLGLEWKIFCTGGICIQKRSQSVVSLNGCHWLWIFVWVTTFVRCCTATLSAWNFADWDSDITHGTYQPLGKQQVIPSGPNLLCLAHSGSQQQHRIWFFLLAHRVCHVIIN